MRYRSVYLFDDVRRLNYTRATTVRTISQAARSSCKPALSFSAQITKSAESPLALTIEESRLGCLTEDAVTVTSADTSRRRLLEFMRLHFDSEFTIFCTVLGGSQSSMLFELFGRPSLLCIECSFLEKTFLVSMVIFVAFIKLSCPIFVALRMQLRAVTWAGPHNGDFNFHFRSLPFPFLPLQIQSF